MENLLSIKNRGQTVATLARSWWRHSGLVIWHNIHSLAYYRQLHFWQYDTGADLGFYKGGCPIHLKGAPPPPQLFWRMLPESNIFLALEEIVGARRSYDI